MTRIFPLTSHCLAYRHNAPLREILNLPEFVAWHNRPLICVGMIPDEFNRQVRKKLEYVLKQTATDGFDQFKEVFNFTIRPDPHEHIERLRCMRTFADPEYDIFDLVEQAKQDFPHLADKLERFREAIGPGNGVTKAIDYPKVTKLRKFGFKVPKGFTERPDELLFAYRTGKIVLSDETYRALTWWPAFRDVEFFKVVVPENPNKTAAECLVKFNDRLMIREGWFYGIQGGIPVKFALDI